METAEGLKERANRCFKSEDYAQAVELYGQAIAALEAPRPEYYTNRAVAHFNLGDFLAAKEDAQKAIDIDPGFVKGYWRMAECLRCTQKLEQSLEYYRKACELKPGNVKIVSSMHDVARLIEMARPQSLAKPSAAPGGARGILQALHQISATTRSPLPRPQGGLQSMFGGPFGGQFGSVSNAPETISEDDRCDTPCMSDYSDAEEDAGEAKGEQGSKGSRQDEENEEGEEKGGAAGSAEVAEAAESAESAEAADSAASPSSEPLRLTQAYVDAVYDYVVVKKKCFQSERMYELIERASTLLSKEPTCVDLTVPEGGKLIVVGDIHGNLTDLARIYTNIVKKELVPDPKARIVFLGDYVDRGQFGHAVVTLLVSLKLCYPDRVVLLRGNHESVSMNSFFGYQSQVENSYGSKSPMFTAVSELFGTLPLACLVNKKVFCAHGGAPVVSKATPQQIRTELAERRVEMNSPISNELCWSDPFNPAQTGPYPSSSQGLGPNGVKPSYRGVGYIYGYSAFRAWAEANGITKMFRAHEVVQPDGVRMDFSADMPAGGPEHYTVFSSGNYMGMPNKGGCVILTEGLTNVRKIILE